MTTALEVAERALKRILVQADDAPLDPSDYADFYDSMNAFMEALEAENVILGYTPVSNPADEVTIPAGAIRGLVANMALEVAPDYGKSTPPELQQQAMDGLRVMRRLGRVRIKQSYPTNLPLGAGQQDFTLDTDPFYGVSAYAVLHLENPDDLLTEFPSTLGNTTPIRGYWEIPQSTGLLADITGRVRNATGEKLSLTVKATLKAIAADTDTFGVSLDNSGVPVDTSIQIATTSPDTLTFTINKAVELEPGGSLVITAFNLTGTNTLKFFDSRVEVS